MKIQKNFFNQFFLDLKLGWKHQWKLVTLYVIVFIYCIKNVIKNGKFGGSNIDSPNWIKSKKCALNHKEIGKNSQGISKVELFISRYNWKGLNYQKKDACRKIE